MLMFMYSVIYLIWVWNINLEWWFDSWC